ncbi:hypothetical protein CEXT_785811 [Caerostris extrusa]|uniref:C2H2-type domain-containing protein n=1 Tax=Caerostris extrusa TaxID=172846 RepID=A0AAV4TWF2_CAEEX|nr:hypothetical protein CEXT_785811 [Caerostris extrusa]
MSHKFDFIKLLCLQCRRRFFSAGGLETHMRSMHGVRIDSANCVPSFKEPSRLAVDPPTELLELGPSTGRSTAYKFND